MPKMRILLAATVLLALSAAGASAQTGGCVEVALDNPPRQAWDCGDGLLIEAEAGLALGPGSPPGEVTVDEGAVLVEVPPGTGDFQILTPHAIASVRGTVFVVDAGEASSSVLVVEGVVEVARRDGSEAVTLTAGEGIDVAEGQPLAAQRWEQPRVSELLARFGR